MFKKPDRADELFRIQAGWTLSTRNFLYRRAKLLNASRVLETGCGTGVILRELEERTGGKVYGLDSNEAYLEFAGERCSGVELIHADAAAIPFDDSYFDIVVCNYFLTWLPDPERVISEVQRVTRPGGYFLICAEPDYEGIIEYPRCGVAEELRKELTLQGLPDFSFGRKLRTILKNMKLKFNSGLIQYDYSSLDYSLLQKMNIPASRLKKLDTFIQPIFRAEVKF